MRGHLLKSATTGVANVAVSAATTAVALPALISVAGLDVYGVWALLGLFVSAAAVLDLGMTRAIVHLVPRRASTQGELLTAAIFIALMAAVLCLAAGALGDAFGFEVLRLPAGIEADVRSALLASGCVVLLSTLLNSILRGFLEAAHASHVANLGFMSLTILQYAVALTVATLWNDAEALVLAAAAVHVSILLLHAVAVGKYCGMRPGQLKLTVVKELIRNAARCFAAVSPTVILVPLLLFWLSSTVGSAKEYGQFDVAFKFATMAGTALSLIAVPVHALVAAMPEPNRESIGSLLRQYLSVTVAALLSGWLLFALIGRGLLHLIVGSAADDIWLACAGMLAGVALLSALEPVQRMLMGLGRFGHLFCVRATVLCASVMSLIAFSGLPALERFSFSYGLGCAAGAVVTAGLMFAVRARLPRRHHGHQDNPTQQPTSTLQQAST